VHLDPKVAFLAVGVHHEFLGCLKLAFYERLAFFHEHGRGKRACFDHFIAGKEKITCHVFSALADVDQDVQVLLVRAVPDAVAGDARVDEPKVIVIQYEGIKVAPVLVGVEITAPENFFLLCL